MSALSSSSSEEQVHGTLSSDGQSFSGVGGVGGGVLADIGEPGTSLAGEPSTVAVAVSRGFLSTSLSAFSVVAVAHVELARQC